MQIEKKSSNRLLFYTNIGSFADIKEASEAGLDFIRIGTNPLNGRMLFLL